VDVDVYVYVYVCVCMEISIRGVSKVLSPFLFTSKLRSRSESGAPFWVPLAQVTASAPLASQPTLVEARVQSHK
jgi:hypothetical protein